MIDLTMVADALAALLLGVALVLVLSGNIQTMIRLYQGQSLLLAAIALVTALDPEREKIILVIVPILIIWVGLIERMLARATVLGHERRSQDDVRVQARSLWLRQGPIRLAALVRVIDWVVVVTAYTVAFANSRAVPGTTIDVFGLAITLGLLILGLLALGTQGHLIAQVMGLLVTEHGLFFAIVRLVHTSVPVFIFSLALYILLTLLILLVLLPGLRRASASMQVIDQRELRG